MKNKELKRELVNSGVYEGFCFNVGENRKKGIYEDNPELYNLTPLEFECCNQLRDAKMKCWSRIYKHFWYLFRYADNLFFVTFTFNDYAMSLTQYTRHQVVGRMLNRVCSDYVANIDYGPLHGREHYHAVTVQLDPADIYTVTYKGKIRYRSKSFDKYAEKYGFYKIEPIRRTDIDGKKVARYIAKITNHSIKVKQSKIMTKKNSDFHFWERHMDRFNREVEYRDSPTFWYNDNTTDKLTELFGIDGFEIVS